MPTAPSSTDVPVAAGPVAEARRASADVAALFRFRLAGLRGRAPSRRPRSGWPSSAPSRCSRPSCRPSSASSRSSRHDVLLLLPSAFLSVLVISIVSAATSRRRPRAAAARPGRRVPGQPDHRPPRRAADGAAQRRLAAAVLDACWARRRTPSAPAPPSPRAGPGAALARRRDRAGAGAGVVRGVGAPRTRTATYVVRCTAPSRSRPASAPSSPPTRLTTVLDKSPTVRIAVGVVDGRDSRRGGRGPRSWSGWSS